MDRTYHIITFGCQMNERDSQTLAGMLEEGGYAFSEDRDAADVVILNTCSVRENADKKFFGVLGQLKHSRRANPGKIVCVCGCMMQQQHVVDALKSKYPWVDIVFGTHNLADFPRLLEGVAKSGLRVVEIESGAKSMQEGLPAKREHSFQAYVNVMYGCNNFCTYCIVPYTRGRERSRRPEDILAEVRSLAAGGCKEITLLGQNVNSYGKARGAEGSYCFSDEPQGLDFAGLLREIDKVEGIERIRFMTSHPKDLSDRLIDCFRDCRHLCRAFHLPVQSGSDAILKKMNRRYDRASYFERVEKLREACPDIALSTDIIVGFPGETEEDFEYTMDLVRRVRYDSAFTFLYSVRRGTPAAAMEDQVPEDVKHARFSRLVELVHEIQQEKSAACQGKILPVLIEGFSKTDKAMLTGRAESGKTVDLPGDASLIGSIIPVRIIKAQTFSFYGEPV